MASSVLSMCCRNKRIFTQINQLKCYKLSVSSFSRRYVASSAPGPDGSQTDQQHPTTPGSDSGEPNISQNTAILEEEKKKILIQFEELQDKYKRSLAETENVRQRLQKQIQDAKLFGIQGFCKDLLEVSDILNRATGSITKEELSSGNSSFKALYEGLQMTEVQLVKVFTRHGLEKINPAEGEKFDPNFHEALFQQPLLEGKTSGTVAIVSKIGYTLHNRTLRPALVGVFGSS